jgi:hypothetical protein
MKTIMDWHKTHHYILFKIIPGRDSIRDESEMFEKFQLYYMYGNCLEENTYEVWYELESYTRESVIDISRELAKGYGVDFEYISNGFVYTRELKAFFGSKKEFKKENG